MKMVDDSNANPEDISRRRFVRNVMPAAGVALVSLSLNTQTVKTRQFG
jgi:hypothetical protein